MLEKPFDSITLQEVLDRAGVARSTFYVHYRDKDDLFLSDAEEFLEAMAHSLSRHGEKSDRVAPVRELFGHVGEAYKLYEALVHSGRLNDFAELARGQFARGIEQRMRELPRGSGIPESSRAALSHAHAGAMLSLLSWWIDRGRRETPQEMDDIFHQAVWGAWG
jgi:AcrR family transcriptional regulator